MNATIVSNKNRIVATFEDFVNQHAENGYWKKVDEIATITGSTTDDVVKTIKTFDEFVKNKENEYTTRRLYRKYTPFFKKFINAYRGKIN